jgi:hypothetical protein
MWDRQILADFSWNSVGETALRQFFLLRLLVFSDFSLIANLTFCIFMMKSDNFETCADSEKSDQISLWDPLSQGVPPNPNADIFFFFQRNSRLKPKIFFRLAQLLIFHLIFHWFFCLCACSKLAVKSGKIWENSSNPKIPYWFWKQNVLFCYTGSRLAMTHCVWRFGRRICNVNEQRQHTHTEREKANGLSSSATKQRLFEEMPWRQQKNVRSDIQFTTNWWFATSKSKQEIFWSEINSAFVIKSDNTRKGKGFIGTFQDET